jgi:hypothetical protein
VHSIHAKILNGKFGKLGSEVKKMVYCAYAELS